MKLYQKLNRFPLGSVKPQGFLRDQLVRNKNGMGGHLDELEPDMIANPFVHKTYVQKWGDGDQSGWGAEISGNYWTGRYEKEYQTVDMECVNNGPENSYIDIPILLYSGYRATDIKTNQELEVVQGENGVVRVVLPSGYAGNIHVAFVSPIYWRISEVISAVFICTFISLCIYNRRRMVQSA